MATNMEMSRDGNTLIITVDLTEEHGVSASKKSIIIASSGGAVPVPDMEDVKVNLNVYRLTKRRG